MFNQNNQTPQQQQQNQYQSVMNQGNKAASTGSGGSSIEVPEAREALNNMKHEIASELGINLKQGYNGDLPSRQAGYIGGYMVKRMIEQAERSMSGR